jgi:hypothetical protein
MEISEIEFSLYLDEKILEFLPERNIQNGQGCNPCGYDFADSCY